MQRPDRDGVYRRHWITRDGEPKQRVCQVEGERVLMLADAKWRALSWFDSLPGRWEYVRPISTGEAA